MKVMEIIGAVIVSILILSSCGTAKARGRRRR